MSSPATPIHLHSMNSPSVNRLARKRLSKRLSSGILVAQPLEEQNHELEEIDRRRNQLRRRSGLLSKTSSLGSNSADKDTRNEPRWTKDQLLQHYSQCIKLSQENKINHKNAFDLQLIEHMGEMILKDGALNFRVAGGAIFAGAKIYASRVDAIHSDIYRVLSSLGSGDKEDDDD
uniref:Condensin complex subunit 2 n=1 Tax=Ciona savignyi TaxID=51511 RepID=H2YJE8_CIOSA